MNPYERFANYNGPKCWQAYISEINLAEDLAKINLKSNRLSSLRTRHFVFDYVPKDDKQGCVEIKAFIERHEWLGKMPIWVTHRFTARLPLSSGNSELAGVIIMATPNTFSYLLGKENKNLEKLISRGACISWAPKNLGSWLIMKSIRWMVKNTEFRVFTAYSDPEAKELGTIYQACNFIYLGQHYGATNQWLDPDNKERGWFGSSGFSDRSQIVRYAKQLGIEFRPEWFKYVGRNQNYRKINWQAIPKDVSQQLKLARDKHKNRCLKRKASVKHKYAYVLGSNPTETKQLRKLFRNFNPITANLTYPKKRGK